MKAQLLVHPVSRAIMCTATGQGATHDLTLFRQSKTRIHPETELLADAGYQGVWREHACSRTPHKATKKKPLTPDQRAQNRDLARARLPVEHVIRCLKIFRCLKDVYRHRRRRFHLRLQLISALYNAMCAKP